MGDHPLQACRSNTGDTRPGGVQLAAHLVHLSHARHRQQRQLKITGLFAEARRFFKGSLGFTQISIIGMRHAQIETD
jgi:hypothetical protein